LPAKQLTTFPNADKLAFMCLASSKRMPVDVVRLTRSLPAKSASTKRPYTYLVPPATAIDYYTSM